LTEDQRVTAWLAQLCMHAVLLKKCRPPHLDDMRSMHAGRSLQVVSARAGPAI